MNSKKPISTIIMLLTLIIFINIFSYLNTLFNNSNPSSFINSEYENSKIIPYMEHPIEND